MTAERGEPDVLPGVQAASYLRELGTVLIPRTRTCDVN